MICYECANRWGNPKCIGFGMWIGECLSCSERTYVAMAYDFFPEGVPRQEFLVPTLGRRYITDDGSLAVVAVYDETMNLYCGFVKQRKQEKSLQWIVYMWNDYGVSNFAHEKSLRQKVNS